MAALAVRRVKANCSGSIAVTEATLEHSRKEDMGCRKLFMQSVNFNSFNLDSVM